MPVQQSITRFADNLNKKTDSVLSLTATLISGEKARCSISPNMQEEKKPQAGILKMSSNISLEQIFNEIVKLRKEMKDYNKSAEFFSAKFDDMNKAIIELRSENDSLKLLCEELKTEKEKRIECEKKIKILEAAIDSHDQYSRRLNLLFDDIDEKKVDMVSEVIEKCKQLQVDLSENDVEVAHRVGKKQGNNNRPIIA